MDSSTWDVWVKWKCKLFVLFYHLFPLEHVLMQWEITVKTANIYYIWLKRRSKVHRRKCHVETYFNFWPMKNIPRKLYANKSVAVVYKITKLRRMISFVTFHLVHSTSKKLSYYPWKNTHSCYMKPKFILRNILLENLLLMKYLTSVHLALK